MLSAGGAWAAENTDAADSTAPRSTASVTEVTVTAEKREEKVMDVPVAISAYTGETRDLIGAVSVYDLTNFVPGLVYSQNLDRAFVRGIGRNTNAPGTDPGVAVYNDGFYTASTVSAGRGPIFTDRVEVLRGPQGTLYGRNSIGGAINIISRQPGEDFGIEARAAISSYLHLDGSLLVDVPVTDSFRIQLGGGVTKQQEGWFHNITGGPDEGGVTYARYGTVQFDWDITENLNAWLRLEYYQYDNRNRQGASYRTYDRTTRTSGLGLNHYYGYTGPENPALTDDYAFNTDTPNDTRLSNTPQAIANVTWDLEGVQIKYVGGYSQYHYRSLSDSDGSPRGVWTYAPTFSPQFTVQVYPVTGIYDEFKKWDSHELNLISTGDGPLQWIVGAYYYHEQFTNFIASISDQPQLKLVAGNPEGYFSRQAGVNTGRSYAAFAQIDYAFNDQWKLTLGLRYNRDDKSGSEYVRYFFFQPVFSANGVYSASDISFSFIPAVCPTGVTTGTTCSVDAASNTRFFEGSWAGWSGTAGLEYHPTDETLAYFRYSRGYKSGGFALGSLSPRPELLPETLDAFELGYKRSWGRMFSLTAAAYYYDYKNDQDFQFVLNTGTNTFQQNGLNIARARTYGLDLESTWAPTDNLTFLLSYSYIHARVVTGCCFVDSLDPLATGSGAQPVGPLIAGQQPQSIAGAHLKGSPDNKVSLTAIYRWDFTEGSLTGVLTMNYRSGVYASFFDRPGWLAPGFSTTNLRFTWQDADNRYSIIAYANNVFNKRGYEYVVPTAATGGGVSYTSPTFTLPRIAGLELQLRY